MRPIDLPGDVTVEADDVVFLDSPTAGSRKMTMTDFVAHLAAAVLASSGTGSSVLLRHTVAEVRAVSSSKDNKILILTGESVPFDGEVSGTYAGVLDPSEVGVDDGISILVPTNRSAVGSADKMYWRKI